MYTYMEILHNTAKTRSSECLQNVFVAEIIQCGCFLCDIVICLQLLYQYLNFRELKQRRPIDAVNCVFQLIL